MGCQQRTPLLDHQQRLSRDLWHLVLGWLLPGLVYWQEEDNKMPNGQVQAVPHPRPNYKSCYFDKRPDFPAVFICVDFACGTNPATCRVQPG